MSLTLAEIKNYVLLDSGQFLFDDETNNDFEFNDTRFKSAIKRCLGIYSRYRSYSDKKQNVALQGDGSYTFTKPYPRLVNNVRYSISPLPDVFRSAMKTNPILKSSYDKTNGILYVAGFAGTPVDFIALYDHVMADDGSVSTIDESDDLFLDLITAYVMRSVGTSRGCFVTEELPYDANEQGLKSDGSDLWDTTIEELRNNQSKWWTAAGVSSV